MSNDRSIKVRGDFSMDDFVSRFNREIPIDIYDLIRSNDASADIAEDVVKLVNKKALDIACSQSATAGDLRAIQEHIYSATKSIVNSLLT